MSNGFLEQLEGKVHAAAERLRTLKLENTRLSQRVADLETDLAEARDSAEAEAWAEERDNIRQRVEKLAATLEGLLAED